MSARQIDFYWDIGSTNSYFAFHLLRPIAARFDATINYIPFNLGYVFRHHNYALPQEPKAKMKNRLVDLMRWARRYELDFKVPAQFPIKTSRALRGALVAQEYGLMEQYMEDLFARYWEQGDATIADYDGLAQTVTKLGLDVEAFIARAEAEDVREKFVALTQKALDEGIFGAPTMRIGEEIYWGKDRFEFIEAHLATLETS